MANADCDPITVFWGQIPWSEALKLETFKHFYAKRNQQICFVSVFSNS